ncbi:hypothetical protein ACXAT3_002768 [Clostridium sporogenes]
MDENNHIYKYTSFGNEFNNEKKSMVMGNHLKNISNIQSKSIEVSKCISSIANVGMQNYLKDIYSIQNKSIEISKCISSIANVGMQNYLKDIYSIQNKSIEISKCISSITNIGMQNYLKDIYSIQNKSIEISKCISSIANVGMQKIIREKYLNQLRDENITINNNGSICVDSQVITKEEIENKIYECVENLYDKSSSFDNLEVKLEFAINKLKGISPELKKILKWIMCNIVIPIIVGVNINIISSNYDRSNDKLVVKNIKKEFKYENFDNQTLKEYRIVSYNELMIKSDCNMKSKTISKLNVGKVVKILYKNKNWSLIEWESEDENINTGWTLTRYLVRIKK